MSWSDALTGPHLDIASSNEPVIHVLAGPGTGKTFSMMRRIQRWLETGVSPQRILAVTFTRTAARDLKDQLARMAIPGAERVQASTLHSLAYSVLAEDEVFQATGRSPRALFSYEVRQLILRNLELDRSTKVRQIAQVERELPRAVVLDLLLPGAEGDIFLRRVRHAGLRDIPVIVVTVKDLSIEERTALDELGVITVLRKSAGVAAAASEVVQEVITPRMPVGAGGITR